MTPDLLPIAAEGSGSGTASTLAIVILLVALAVFAIAYFLVGPGQRRGPRLKGDIPLAMRPYHSDDELETTGLERAMSWGVALSLFAALFLPLYWLIEPERINDKRDEFYLQDVAEGRSLYAENCTTCHGDAAQGGFASAPGEADTDAPWPAPALDNIVARYEDSDIVEDVKEFMTQTIKRGRAGTPMPAWGAAFQGPLNDQQIEAIVTYLLSIQTGEVEEVDAQAFVGKSGGEIYGNNCARCHGGQAQGYVGPNLVNVFERYGAEEGDQESIEDVRNLIRFTILHGRNVPTKANMPSFANELTDDAITKVIDYLESIQKTGGPDFGQIGGPPQSGDSSDANSVEGDQ